MPLLLTPLIASFVVLLWTTGAEPTVITGWSAVALMYFLFFAPSECVVFDTNHLRCRAAADGLLRSCKQDEHPRNNLRRFVPASGGGWWRARGSELVSTPRNLLTTVGAATSLTSLLFVSITRVI